MLIRFRVAGNKGTNGYIWVCSLEQCSNIAPQNGSSICLQETLIGSEGSFLFAVDCSWLGLPVNAMPGLEPPPPEPEDVFWRVRRCGELCTRTGSCWKARSSPAPLDSFGRAEFYNSREEGLHRTCATSYQDYADPKALTMLSSSSTDPSGWYHTRRLGGLDH